MIDVCLLGSGGVMPLPGRALSSLFVKYNGAGVLIDCGEGTQTELRRSAQKYSQTELILFTHLHADHISGLAGFLLTLGLEGRDRPLKIYGPRGIRACIKSLLTIAPELPYEINITELDGEGEFTFHEIGLRFTAFPLMHSVPCLGYKAELDRAPKFDPLRAKEKNIPVALWSRLQHGESVGGFSPSDVLGEPRAGISLLYATDTKYLERIAELGRGTDLMILEGMWADDEKQEKASATGHMTMNEAAELAAKAETGELWITHISPATPEPDIYEESLKEIFENTVIGKDGLVRTISFE